MKPAGRVHLADLARPAPRLAKQKPPATGAPTPRQMIAAVPMDRRRMRHAMAEHDFVGSGAADQRG